MPDRSLSTQRDSPTVWVPLALPEDEARAAFNACRAVFAQLTAIGEASTVGELARAMLKIGQALDRAREEASCRS